MLNVTCYWLFVLEIHVDYVLFRGCRRELRALLRIPLYRATLVRRTRSASISSSSEGQKRSPQLAVSRSSELDPFPLLLVFQQLSYCWRSFSAR